MGKLTGQNGNLESVNTEKYSRDRPSGSSTNKPKKVKNGKLRNSMKVMDQKYKESLRSTAATEILLAESSGHLEAEGLEKTYRYKQEDIVKEVDQSTANKAINLKLDQFGPYTLNYTRNGTHLLIGGKKGHVASMDWRKGELKTELHLNETVNAVQYLQSEQYFAVAQKKYTFIYDHEGTELHRMKQHIEVQHMEFLPYHYLLATSGHTGMLKYHDVSTGVLANDIKTKMGPSTAMAQNPWNAIIHLGSSTGVVSLWSPAANEPLVKIQACAGPVRGITIDRSGHYMAVAGADKTLKVWDVRNYQELYSYSTPTPVSDIQFSDTGLLSASWGPNVTVWKDSYKSYQKKPYMSHLIPGSKIEKLQFVPFEDLLGVGHSKGVQNLIIPGSGEANFDALEINPYETAKQRQESEVRSLLNKLPADSISLDPNYIGNVAKQAPSERLTHADRNELDKKQGNLDDSEQKIAPRPEVKGKNSALRRHLRKKQQNVIDERKMRVEANLKREKEMRQKRLRQEQGHVEEKELVGSALSRFK